MVMCFVPPEGLVDAVSQALNAATYQGCAAAGHKGCCTEGDCKAASGCYCDVTCYYFRTCCDDITANGCYRKNTLAKNVNNIQYLSQSINLSLVREPPTS